MADLAPVLAPILAAAPEKLVNCCSCTSTNIPATNCGLVQKACPIKGTKEQWRCNQCNACKSRMARATAQNQQLKKIGQLKPDDRKKLMDDAKSLCGDELTKCMMESIVECTMKRN